MQCNRTDPQREDRPQGTITKENVPAGAQAVPRRLAAASGII